MRRKETERELPTTAVHVAAEPGAWAFYGVPGTQTFSSALLALQAVHQREAKAGSRSQALEPGGRLPGRGWHTVPTPAPQRDRFAHL